MTSSSYALQARDTLGALAERWKVLRLGEGLRLSRHAAHCRRPISLRKVTMYSAAWVKSQARMASTSNQETFRTELEGRLVFDILRQVHCHAVPAHLMATCAAWFRKSCWTGQQAGPSQAGLGDRGNQVRWQPLGSSLKKLTALARMACEVDRSARQHASETPAHEVTARSQRA